MRAGTDGSGARSRSGWGRAGVAQLQLTLCHEQFMEEGRDGQRVSRYKVKGDRD